MRDVFREAERFFDGDLAELIERFTAYKTISVKLESPADDLSGFGEIISQNHEGAVFRIPKSEAPATTAKLLEQLAVTDLTVEDPPIEEIIDRVFRQDEPS